jgi:subtilisin family serine protease
MRIIMLLCVSVSLLLAACSTTPPEGSLQRQSLDPLPWAKPKYFSSLSPESDYFSNELIAIFERGGDERQPNVILNEAVEFAVKDGLVVNGITVQPDSIVLIDTYSTNATVPAITLAPKPVCGKIISHFRYSFPILASDKEKELQQAIDTLRAMSDQYLQAQGKELYGISPRGKGPGLSKGKALTALVAPTPTNQPKLYSSFIAPAFISKNWSYIAVNAVQGISAAGVRVAVLDTGVNPVGSFKLDSPANFVTLDPNAGDDFDLSTTSYLDGHGTGVASLIADSTYGIAPDAIIIPVKVCDGKGICDDITVTRGICYAQFVGTDVINLSLGTLSNAPMVRQAIREVVARGTTVVASAGNTNLFPSPRQNRADYPAGWASGTSGFMSVGAIDQKLAYADFATANSAVELVAPGADLQPGSKPADATGIETFSADGNRVFMEGTSFAAPFVAGAAANLYAQCPSLAKNTSASSRWVETTLKSTVTPWKPISQVATRKLPWPLSTNGFTPGLLNVGNSLKVTCP